MLANAFLLSLPKEDKTSFYKENQSFIKEVLVNDHILIKGRAYIHQESQYHHDYFVSLSIFVDGIDTETYLCKLDSYYYSRFENIQGYICKEVQTYHKLPEHIIDVLNDWSKAIIIPIHEEDQRIKQTYIQQAEERYQQEEQTLSIYR